MKWNSFPNDFKELKSSEAFKKSLHLYGTIRQYFSKSKRTKAERNGGNVASKAAPEILMIRWNPSELSISRLKEKFENSFSFFFYTGIT